MKLLSAELIETREFLPGQWLQRYRAPSLASSALAGQFVHVRTPDYSGLVLRRPFSINTYDRAKGEITIHFRVTGVGTQWMARTQRDPRTRHVLLVAGGLGMAGVRSLADEALAAGCNVTVLFGAASAQQVYPSSLLPDEVEYVVATDDGSFGHHGFVTELLPQFEAWADQCFACGPQPMLAAMARLAAGRQARLGVARLGARRGRATKSAPLGSKQARRRAWLQVSMEQNMGCAVGACLGCVVMCHDGPQRVCREGPVFASDEINWEGWR